MVSVARSASRGPRRPLLTACGQTMQTNRRESVRFASSGARVKLRIRLPVAGSESKRAGLLAVVDVKTLLPLPGKTLGVMTPGWTGERQKSPNVATCSQTLEQAVIGDRVDDEGRATCCGEACRAVREGRNERSQRSSGTCLADNGRPSANVYVAAGRYLLLGTEDLRAIADALDDTTMSSCAA